MSEFLEINIVNSVAVFFAAIIPLFLSIRLNGIMQKLTLLLSAAAFVHAFYHIFEVIGYDDFAENIVEPLSIVILIIFGLLYLRVRTAKRINA